jgi:hypothetical protein
MLWYLALVRKNKPPSIARYEQGQKKDNRRRPFRSSEKKIVRKRENKKGPKRKEKREK